MFAILLLMSLGSIITVISVGIRQRKRRIRNKKKLEEFEKKYPPK